MKKIVLMTCVLCMSLFCNSLKTMGNELRNFENSEEMKAAVAYNMAGINTSSLSKALRLSNRQAEEIQTPMEIFGMETSELGGVYDVYHPTLHFRRYLHENIYNITKNIKKK